MLALGTTAFWRRCKSSLASGRVFFVNSSVKPSSAGGEKPSGTVIRRQEGNVVSDLDRGRTALYQSRWRREGVVDLKTEKHLRESNTQIVQVATAVIDERLFDDART